jgi:hypothetical protein
VTTRRLGAAVLVTVVVLAVGTAAPVVGSATHSTANSPTYISSDIATDTTWTPENGPYILTSDIHIKSDATLTIHPGTVVQVAEETSLTVRGSLQANGTTSAPIKVTTARPSPTAGAWDTIRYEGGTESKLHLRNTTVQYAKSGLTLSSGKGEVSVTDSRLQTHVRAGIRTADSTRTPTLQVTNSRISDTQYAGIALEATGNDPYLDAAKNIQIRGTTIQNTGTYGMRIRAKHVAGIDVIDASIGGFKSSGISLDTGPKTTGTPSERNQHIRNTRITDTTISNDRGAGISLASAHTTDITLSRNTVQNVDGNGIQILRTFSVDQVTIASNSISNTNNGVYINHHKLDGPIQTVSLDITGNTLQRNSKYGLRVSTDHAAIETFNLRHNSFTANGYDGARVTTPVLDNTAIVENTARNNGGTGIQFTSGAATDVTINANRFKGNQQDGLLVSAADTMSDVTITENHALDNDAVGITVAHSTPAADQIRLSNNTVAGNDLGLLIEGPSPTVITNNSIVFNTRGAGAAPGSINRATGVLIRNANSNTTLRHNDIYGHITGLRSQTDGTVNATDNYWGAETGPYYASINPNGAGNPIETDNGTVQTIPFTAEQYGPQYQRPQPRLIANQTTVTPNEAVSFTASGSTNNGDITSYRYTIQNTTLRPQSTSTMTHSFSEPGTYEVSVTLRDNMGVESLTAATATITVKPKQNQTTTTVTTTPTPTTANTPTPTPGNADGNDGGVLASLQTIWGAVGATLYLFALLVGVYGVYRSLDGRAPPTRGRNVHLLVAAAAVTWITGGLTGSSSLLLVSAGGVGLWIALTVGLYIIATR